MGHLTQVGQWVVNTVGAYLGGATTPVVAGGTVWVCMALFGVLVYRMAK